MWEVVGPALADRTYAYLYTQPIRLGELHKHPQAQVGFIRTGLLEMARAGSFDEILMLQEFACLQRDADALREAQALWKRYANEPQLRPPEPDLNAPCRQ